MYTLEIFIFKKHMTDQAIIIMTSYPNNWRTLKRFISALVKSWVARCVQRINYMKSYYMREWKLKQEEEKLLLIKTMKSKQEKAIQMIKQQHPYEIPEILVLHANDSDQAYMQWLKK